MNNPDKDIFNDLDYFWINEALLMAKKAALRQEVPVGAIVIANQQPIAVGHNQPISQCDPTAHGEIVALRQAALKMNNYRLNNTTLYVTLEPCAMCLGAMLQARIQRLVFGAYDPKAGAVVSVFQLLDSQKLNHRIEWRGGILTEQCAAPLKDFFHQRRKPVE